VRPAATKGKALVVGLGGLGCPAALVLARAGVGLLGLADGDRVELSNLHRQLLHTVADLGGDKVTSAAHKLERFDPPLPLRLHPDRLDAGNAAAILAEYDVTVDATDDAATKFLLNDAAVLARRPLVHAGVVGFRGQLMTIVPGETACLRCVFPSVPATEEPTCHEAGILGPIAGVVGALQAEEALRCLAGTPGLAGRLLTFDFRRFRFREVGLSRSFGCPVCASVGAIRSADARVPFTPGATPSQENR
jgi:molybdopterin/thiamine biosynthesis adenylyltransferase